MNKNGIVLTADILDMGLSANGAYNYDQLHTLGVSIPLKKGWRRELIGKTISHEALDRFLALKNAHLPSEKRANQAVTEEIIEICRDCRYWSVFSSDDDDIQEGYCRRYPQKLTKEDYEWCGEFKSKQSL